ncbi:MAG TPA: hypothetical protein PLD84_03170 [Chitinophagales bacterium]|nr:hypothetical protein [Chitinophagales bacterium]
MNTISSSKSNNKKVPSPEDLKLIENYKRKVAHLEAAAAYHTAAAARYHLEARKYQALLKSHSKSRRTDDFPLPEKPFTL